MGRKDKAAAGEGEGVAEPKAKSKSNLVPAVIVAAGLLGGGWFMGGKGGGGAAEPAGAEQTTTTTTEAPGPILSLGSITLNVADGHFLKVGIAVRVSPDHAPGGGGHGGGSDSDPSTELAPVLDEVIAVLGGRTYGELVTPEGRDAAKEALVQHLEEALPHVIQELYFTEFVMQ